MNDLNPRTPIPSSVDDLNFESLSWGQVYDLLLNLAEDILKSEFRPDIIVGVSRGGWIPARILSDLLETPKLANVTAEFYVGINETIHEPAITQPLSLPVMGRKVLIVDDLVDTGKSLNLVNLHLENQGASEVRIATIYFKPWSITIPDYFEKETRNWIVFPWELKETVKKTVETFKTEGRTLEEVKKKLIGSGIDRKLTEHLIKKIVSDED